MREGQKDVHTLLDCSYARLLSMRRDRSIVGRCVLRSTAYTRLDRYALGVVMRGCRHLRGGLEILFLWNLRHGERFFAQNGMTREEFLTGRYRGVGMENSCAKVVVEGLARSGGFLSINKLLRILW